jgi:hypothetical protein
VSIKEDNGKESKEPGYDYGEDKDQLEEKQEEETVEKATTNSTF